jgi:L-lactate dehydrogenase complex protein LldE
MRLGLFIPCYIDASFPEVGIATLELLERLGCSVEYPLDQVCCGQPMANSGRQDDPLKDCRDSHLLMETVQPNVVD